MPGAITVPLADDEARRHDDVPRPVEAPNGWGRVGVARVDADHYHEPLHAPHAVHPVPHGGEFGHGYHSLGDLLGNLAGFGGHGLGDLGAYDHAAPVFVMPVEHLQINNNTFIQNNLTENNTLIFNAADGGHLDVGGDVNALALGSSHVVVDEFHQAGSPADAGFGGNGFFGGGGGNAGGFDAVLVGHLPAEGGSGPSPLVIIPIEHLEVNNNTFVQNTQTENNTLVFNAGNGGTIGVDGDINAVANQQALVDHHV